MILIDNMLSFKLKYSLREIGATFHLSDLGLQNATDNEVWNFSLENNYTILTKDTDFIDIQNLEGFPPKIIRITLGNASTEAITNLLISRRLQITSFLNDTNKGVLFL